MRYIAAIIVILGLSSLIGCSNNTPTQLLEQTKELLPPGAKEIVDLGNRYYLFQLQLDNDNPESIRYFLMHWDYTHGRYRTVTITQVSKTD